MLKPLFNNANSFKLIFSLGVLMFISGCQTLDTSKYWPNDIPDRSIFVKAYMDKRNLESVDPRVLDSHLIWIIRFYHGTVIYPNGWNQASEMLLASVDEKQLKKEISIKINELGIKIANEWAQENEFRNINNTNIATWGSALRTSAERDDQEGFIAKIDADVDALVERRISPSDISYERYYPADDFDDF